MAEGKKVGLWIGIGCLVAVALFVLPVLFCVGTCGVGAAGVYVISEQAATEARDFFGDLRSGNVDGAYARTTESFRQTHPLESLRASVARFPILRQNTTFTVTGRSVNAGERTEARLSGVLSGPNETASVTMTLVRVGEQWLIESVTINGQPL